MPKSQPPPPSPQKAPTAKTTRKPRTYTDEEKEKKKQQKRASRAKKTEAKETKRKKDRVRQQERRAKQKARMSEFPPSPPQVPERPLHQRRSVAERRRESPSMRTIREHFPDRAADTFVELAQVESVGHTIGQVMEDTLIRLAETQLSHLRRGHLSRSRFRDAIAAPNMENASPSALRIEHGPVVPADQPAVAFARSESSAAKAAVAATAPTTSSMLKPTSSFLVTATNTTPAVSAPTAPSDGRSVLPTDPSSVAGGSAFMKSQPTASSPDGKSMGFFFGPNNPTSFAAPADHSAAMRSAGASATGGFPSKPTPTSDGLSTVPAPHSGSSAFMKAPPALSRPDGKSMGFVFSPTSFAPSTDLSATMQSAGASSYAGGTFKVPPASPAATAAGRRSVRNKRKANDENEEPNRKRVRSNPQRNG